MTHSISMLPPSVPAASGPAAIHPSDTPLRPAVVTPVQPLALAPLEPAPASAAPVRNRLNQNCLMGGIAGAGAVTAVVGGALAFAGREDMRAQGLIALIAGLGGMAAPCLARWGDWN